MRRNVEFPSKGLQCRGWLYVPEDLPDDRAAPAVVMGHGFSAVKEMFQLSSPITSAIGWKNSLN